MSKNLKVNEMKRALEKACHTGSNKELKELASEYYDVEQVMELLRFKNKQSVYNLVNSNKLKAIKPVGKLLFKKSEIVSFIEGRHN